MPLPLVPLLIGAAAGAAITYFAMTRSSRNPFKGATQNLTDSVEDGASKVKNAVSDVVDDATRAVKGAAKKVSK